MAITKATLRSGLLLQAGQGLWKISGVYEKFFTAQFVYPLPHRTTVQQFSYLDLYLFMPPSPQILRKYDEAYGFSEPTT